MGPRDVTTICFELSTLNDPTVELRLRRKLYYGILQFSNNSTHTKTLVQMVECLAYQRSEIRRHDGEQKYLSLSATSALGNCNRIIKPEERNKFDEVTFCSICCRPSSMCLWWFHSVKV